MEQSSQDVSKFCELSQNLTGQEHSDWSSYSKNNVKRIMIERIELFNFKSYNGLHIIGPLHKRFNTVVGPNGNGKSNLIEAIMFVFGKKANKIRLKKLKELIHRSNKHQDCGTASVTVYFQEIIDDIESDDNFSIIENSKFYIRRTVNQSSTSKYYLNGKETPFSEIGVLLIKKGVDLENNRFIVVQGEVEQISLMKPTSTASDGLGFLEYIEDIIGTFRFLEEMDKVVPQLKDARDKRNEEINKLNVEYQNLQTVENEKNKVKNYMTKENLQSVLKILLLDLKRHTLKLKLEEFNASIKTLEGSYDEQDKNRKAIIEKFNKETNLLEEIKQKMAAIKAEEDVTKKTVAGIVQKDNDVRKENSRLDKSIKDLESQVEDINVKYIKAIEANVSLEEEIDIKSKEIIKIQEQYQVKEKEFNDHKASIDASTGPLKAKIAILLETKLNQKKINCTHIEEVIASLQNELQMLQSRQADVQSKKEKHEDAIASKKNHYNDSIEQLKVVKERLTVLNQNYSSKQNSLKIAQEHQRDVEKKLKDTFTFLNFCKNEMANLKYQQKIITDIMGAQSSKTLSGIYGRLGDLGFIDPQYDVAVSTACGILDYLLVDNVSSATKVINYLKQNKIGSISIISLDKVTENYHPQNFEPPENSSRLFDLIKFKDPIFAPAFYFGLQNTLVVRNLDKNAMYLGYNKKFRIVTLDGNLIESSGVMSGGGTQKRGAMKLTSQTQEVSFNKIEQLDKDLETYTKQNQDLLEEVGKLDSEVQEMAGQVLNYEREERKLNLTIKTSEAEISNLEIQWKKVDMENNDSKKKSSSINIEDDIESQQTKLSKMKNEIKEIEIEVAQIEEQIELTGGDEYKRLKSHYDLLKVQFQNESDTLTKNKTQFELNSKAMDECKESQNKIELKIESNKKRKAEIKEVQANNEKELEEFSKKANEITEKYKEIVESYQAKEKQFSIVRDDIKKIEKEMENINDEIEKIKREIDDVKQPYNEETDTINRARSIYQKGLEDFNKLKEINSAEQKFEELLQKPIFKDRLANEDHKAIVAEKEAEKKLSDENQPNPEEGVQKMKPIEPLESVAEKYNPLEDVSQIIYDLCKDRTKEIEIMIETITEKLKTEECYIKTIGKYLEQMRALFKEAEALDLIDAEYEKCKKKYESSKDSRLRQFLEGFTAINSLLGEAYSTLTRGGEAKLDLVDQTDPFIDGVVFRARPPNKSWRPISKLSGGEKTLSSLSFLFALHHYKPSALFCMDEIDAALDHSNVAMVARFIKQRTKDSQFIVISLRNHMLEMSFQTIGIYKVKDLSYIFSFLPNPPEFTESQKKEIQKLMEKKQQKEKEGHYVPYINDLVNSNEESNPPKLDSNKTVSKISEEDFSKIVKTSFTREENSKIKDIEDVE